MAIKAPSVEKVFKPSVSESGRVLLGSSPKTGKTRARIYTLWNVETGETYIGKTDQEFRKRLSQHSYNVNHGAKTPLYEALRKDPLNFRFGLFAKEDIENLSELERNHIDLIPEGKKLNCNSGGGGGTSSEALSDKGNLESKELFVTPKKYHPLKKQGSAIKFHLPEEDASSKGNIYAIKQKSTGKRYIGYTGQEMKKRCSQHAYNSKHTKLPLYEAIQKDPEDFWIGLLARNVDPKELPGLESTYIKIKDSVTNGFNQNQGGGGSHTSKS